MSISSKIILMILKKWKIAEPITNQIKAQFSEIELVLLQLLVNRSLMQQEAIDEFLNPDWGEDVHDPYLFKDMAMAVDRIYRAIKMNELICVYADYDADGVTGAVILVSSLRKLGAEVQVYLPHREREGYGINQAAVRYLADKQVKLIITCDCGVANVEEITLAASLGIDTIITDHHQAKETLPPAVAIIHPSLPRENYPGKNLSGGATAYKLVQGLLSGGDCELGEKEKEVWEKWLLDLVAISLVADMVPLLGEARTLVKYGLVVLQKNRRLGLQKLIEVAGVNPELITTNTIGWQIAPRINAAGRMDHANAGYQLLMSEDSCEAEELARSLNLTNTERQRVSEEMLQQALEQVGKLKRSDYAVFTFMPEWPLGVVGLVAGKLVQKYNRPALVMCAEGDNIVGSARSIPALDLMQVLKETDQHLIKYGGHKQAAGYKMTKANYEKFIKAFNKVARQHLKDKDLTPVLELDAELELAKTDWLVYEAVQKLEPTGQTNPIPLFALFDLEVVAINPVGSEGQHWRLQLRQGEVEKKFITFNALQKGVDLKVGDKIDVAFEVGVNEWNGNRELQLKIMDFKHHE
ncbi:MAG: single-stranded-DNA-specific exonuclease RecJ [Patescibacteria group bacterium]